MKELFGDIAKQRSSLPIFLGVVLVLFGISSGVKWGENSLTIEPAYRITGIVIGGILIFVGFILNWSESLYFKQKPKNDSVGSLASQSVVVRSSFLRVSQIDVLGYSLRNFIHNNQQTLVQSILNGASIRLIVIDPDGEAIKLIEGIKPSTGLADDVRRSLQISNNIIEDSKESVRGKFDIRVIDWIPSCSLTILDASSDNGWIEVGIFPPNYKRVAEKKAYIQFAKKENESWFVEYTSEFNDLWNIAKPYKYKVK
jgi:hypothetical protein